MTKGGVNAGQ